MSITLVQTPTRPVLRYHGGKWRMAKHIIQYFPPHRIYVEPFGGAASVLMQKPRTYSEVYNDLDEEITNVFAVMRDPEASDRLKYLLEWTPYSRSEFESAYEHSDDPIEQARRTIIKSFMGFGSAAIHSEKPRGMRTRASTWHTPTGFRSNSNRSGTTPAHDWMHYSEHISTFHDRLQGVVIETKPAIDVISNHDREDTLFYVDPPYVLSTRDKGTDYKYEMTDQEHIDLADILHKVKGLVVLSGYDCPLYDRLYSDWRKVAFKAFADGAAPRMECLWLSPRSEQGLNGRLF